MKTEHIEKPVYCKDALAHQNMTRTFNLLREIENPSYRNSAVVLVGPTGVGKSMYLSTLRSHIEAMGGQLEVVARFPDGAVKISNFGDLGSASMG